MYESNVCSNTLAVHCSDCHFFNFCFTFTGYPQYNVI